MALTALKRYDNYTFTHMVNVSVLAMAQARSLNIDGTLLREFGFAALMHDIGKVHTPLEVLNKPDKLTKEEFDIMKRHVVDGAHILRRTPEMPALAPIVAFEHHLRQDLSGYPENIGHRKLNLCTQIVSIADVYDALRSNRVYREGLPSDRIRSIMTQKDSPAFNTGLLRRFINLMGMFPVGTLVRLRPRRSAVVTHEHPTDPFRPQVKIVLRPARRARSRRRMLRQHVGDRRPRRFRGVVEAVDPESVGIDPLTLSVTMARHVRTRRSPTDAASRLADFARACKAAARAVSLYPAAHPAIGTTLDRLVETAGGADGGGPVQLQVRRTSCSIGGAAPAKPDPAIVELADLLSRQLIGTLTRQRGRRRRVLARAAAAARRGRRKTCAPTAGSRTCGRRPAARASRSARSTTPRCCARSTARARRSIEIIAAALDGARARAGRSGIATCWRCSAIRRASTI